MERRTALQALLLLALPAACRSAGSDGPTYNGPRPSVRAVFVSALTSPELQPVLRELGGGYLGVLDASGNAAASMTLPAGTDPSLAGATLHHAFLAAPSMGGAELASNAWPLTLTP
jgi:hypothetical protein